MSKALKTTGDIASRSKPRIWVWLGPVLLFCCIILLFILFFLPARSAALYSVNSGLSPVKLHSDEEPKPTPEIPKAAEENELLPETTPEPSPVVQSSHFSLLKLNDGYPAVQTLQVRLMDLGYLDSDEPGSVYNEATQDAVSMFQRAIGAVMDGIAHADLQEKLFGSEAKTYEVKLGDSGSDVKSVQNMLKTLGYFSGKVNGYFGTSTEDALKAFQKKNSLSEDGIYNVDDRDLLMSEKALPLIDATPKPKKHHSSSSSGSSGSSSSSSGSSSGSYPTGGSFNASHNADGICSVAEAQIGKRYVLGDEGPDTFDCSGLVYYCLRMNGVSCGRRSAASYAEYSQWGLVSNINDLRKGDLIFFRSDSAEKISHVGIYIGGGKMIDASSSNGCVVRRSAHSEYWSRNFVCGRRIYG